MTRLPRTNKRGCSGLSPSLSSTRSAVRYGSVRQQPAPRGPWRLGLVRAVAVLPCCTADRGARHSDRSPTAVAQGRHQPFAVLGPNLAGLRGTMRWLASLLDDQEGGLKNDSSTSTDADPVPSGKSA
jgi:hypothetical protein